MELESILTTINCVGFPIAVCLLLMWYIYTTQNKLTDAIDSLRECIIKLEVKLTGDKRKGDEE